MNEDKHTSCLTSTQAHQCSVCHTTIWIPTWSDLHLTRRAAIYGCIYTTRPKHESPQNFTEQIQVLTYWIFGAFLPFFSIRPGRITNMVREEKCVYEANSQSCCVLLLTISLLAIVLYSVRHKLSTWRCYVCQSGKHQLHVVYISLK